MMGKESLISLVLLTFLLSVAASSSDVGYDPMDLESEESLGSLYQSWLAKHGKEFSSLDEMVLRFEIFKNNLKFIHDHNRNAIGNDNYWLGLNRFADMTHDEFKNIYLGSRFARKGARTPKTSFRYKHLLAAAHIDWREKGAIARVKDQGSCGSCWAFSTIASVEGINQIMNGILVTLSEQELVDCDTEYNEGCDGGLMDYAFEFIISNGGIDSEKDYPYSGVQGECIKDKLSAHVVNITSYEDVPQNDEDSLEKAVSAQPVAVAIEASSRGFQFYSSVTPEPSQFTFVIIQQLGGQSVFFKESLTNESLGLTNNQKGAFTTRMNRLETAFNSILTYLCMDGLNFGKCGTDLDHGVLVAGYGTDSGKDYWIVKNSWGDSWGENGYIRLQRHVKAETGKCGIAMEPSYPIIEVGNLTDYRPIASA